MSGEESVSRAGLIFYTVANREGLSATFGSSSPLDWEAIGETDEQIAAMVADSNISLFDAVAAPEAD